MHNIKVLFVCSGNNISGRSANVNVQAAGLTDDGADISFFEITGKGMQGYFRNIFKLRKFLSGNRFDVIHAHYGLSGIVASFAGAKPMVVTLMGSELYMSRGLRMIMRFFVRFVWKNTIVQSEKMKELAGGGTVLPNGVDIKRFSSVDADAAKKETGFDDGRYIIWVSDPKREEKNFSLAKEAFDKIKTEKAHLETVYGKPHEKIPFYFKAADVLLLTSKWEGSPIVVKEALAAGLPVVSVEAGDVKEILSGVEGCFVTGYNAGEIARTLDNVLMKKERIRGMEKIRHLDMKVISGRLKDMYKEMISQ